VLLVCCRVMCVASVLQVCCKCVAKCVASVLQSDVWCESVAE